MANNDYQLEELENQAVNKSGMAKRAAAAAGLVAAGAGSAYAATTLLDGMNDDKLTAEDLLEVGETGAEQAHEVLQEPKPEVHVHENTTNFIFVENPVPEQAEQHAQTEPQVEFDAKINVHDEDGNLLYTQETGKINGYDFKLVDVDNDNMADALGVDVNGNHVYEEDEIFVLQDEEKISMDNPVKYTRDVVLQESQPEDIDSPLWADADNIDDIPNDFSEEKSGDDYAAYSENYENNASVDNYDDRYETLGSEDYAEAPLAESYDDPADDYEDYADASDYSEENEGNYMAMEEPETESYDVDDCVDLV